MIPVPNPNNNYNIGAIQQIIPRPNPQHTGGKRKATRKARKATKKTRK
jgi:hypothetical protein